jgi:predicted Zn-dependent protease
MGDRLVADVDHMGMAGGVEMGKCLFHGSTRGGEYHSLPCRTAHDDVLNPLRSSLLSLVSPSLASLKRGLAVILCATLAIAPVPALAQPASSATSVSNLPRLGDAGADTLSPDMERRIGVQIVRQMHRERVIADDPEVADWLNAFAGRLAASTTAAGHALELFLVRDGTLNAFALPGGFIGVHSGLIVAAQSESELASVVAHEIGHVTQRHIARMLARDRQSSVVMLASLVLAALAATTNPQAALGVASLGATVAQQQMLGFSREAEREADRIGLDMLRESGYDANGMVSILGRLQQAGRLYENGAPDYLRSHPVTSERMADIQNRLGELRYRQHADSREFLLVQARLRALANIDVDGLARAAASFERQLRNRTIDEAAGWFGLATVHNAQRRPDAAREALAKVRAITGPIPFVERLAAQIELEAGR